MRSCIAFLGIILVQLSVGTAHLVLIMLIGGSSALTCRITIQPLTTMKNDEENQFLPALLKALCPDDMEEAHRRYLVLHKKLVGYFTLKGMSDPFTDADDTVARADEKIAKGKKVPDVTRFCMGIARNIVRERLREEKRKESAFREFWDTNKDKNTRAALLDQFTNLMRRCFKQLPKDDQSLLIAYCKGPSKTSLAEHRHRLAESHNWSIGALRIRITRLRVRLVECLKELSETL